MNNSIALLSATAISIGFVHTLFGPDHYLPFIVMSKARNWSLGRTMILTFFCGLGHVFSSVLIGILGVSVGIALSKLEAFESIRGSLAGWALMAFGLVYTVWGIRNAIRNKPHSHLHLHADGGKHTHEHTHHDEHSHVHDAKKKNITPWILFTIFVLGPCEPLIPILMYPAAQKSVSGLVFVTIIFAVTTIGTMMAVVFVASLGLKMVFFKTMERYTHALAGGIILLSGVAINFLGL